MPMHESNVVKIAAFIQGTAGAVSPRVVSSGDIAEVREGRVRLKAGSPLSAVGTGIEGCRAISINFICFQ